MQKYILILLLGLMGCAGRIGSQEEIIHKEDTSPVDYVNPYLGNISHLLVPTFPTVHLPNSMLRVIPERADFTSDKIKGLPTVTTSHRGESAFTISPSYLSDELSSVVHYSYDQEKITPYSYDVYLDEEAINVAYGLSHQSGVYIFDFKKQGDKVLMINNKSGEIKIESNSIYGYQLVDNEVTKNNTKVYIYLETEELAESFGILENGKINTTLHTSEGKNKCAALTFSKETEQLKVKYGVSFISCEQAKKNLERELKGKSMADLRADGKQKWNNVLSKIKISGKNQEDLKLFYTSLYRTYERPVCISEDGFYFSAFDGNIHRDNGTPFYTDDWIWDTYRATHPLRILTEKKLEKDILNSYIRMAEQMPNFWMPTFPEVMGDSRRMNSNHGVATVLDAAAKGLDGFDLEKAYEACKNAITEKTLAPWSWDKAGELDVFYKENGYFPALAIGEKETVPEVHHHEKRQPIAVTLGTVYDEWCLSEIAKMLGKEQESHYFFNRSLNYRKVFNTETGFFHPKDKNGNFIEPFDYKFSGGMGARDYYGENNAWVYRWDVPHNVADLISLMGGEKQFIKNLDATFNEPLGRSKYAFFAQLPDHSGNVGQFSMANEPSLHIPYLYNYAGQPWKSQKRIKQLVRMWFRNDLMGIPGDEDGGGMSAFVAFSQMGFYPVTAGMPSYNIGTPFFDEVSIKLGNGSVFTIEATNLSEENKYIQSATLNGKDWNKPWFPHSEIANGGKLELVMGPKANYNWGISPSDAPPSAGDLKISLAKNE
ncbi:GH92 family glycosyl hydrolase [Flammeovirga aprica]|uniref:Glycoside hydrolase family 92 protein n=1 Tax=Flammeovirga aprica JL-4 TaxID=694437 RepID=A0A7X9XAG6_9BACT|nr:GH92 family glycosyl hydrolase [Flammeovirga aprica]NME69672.1 glycoside hydrolase family 92 protein [Flammeovirga aprica JL-4]